MLHRHAAHGEAVARIGWCITERRIGVITGEVGAGETIAVRAALSTLDASRHTLRRRMKMGMLAALDQRIGLRYAMGPMTSEETGSYLRHHLALAGRSDTLFSDDATP
jgi:type II secretory pathway predicted ATPase ExeA